MPQSKAVARVLEKLTATARKHRMLLPGQTVLVACSGGPDSSCLLHALVRLRRLFRIRLVVFHFDHRLRARSGDDAAYVRRQAARLGLPFFLREAEDRPEPGQSVEAWARLARYAALTSAATEAAAEVSALGHTLDDQAETVLLGLVRGGGIEAVAGMPPVGGIPPLGIAGVRPLIETTREEVLSFCHALRLRPREDPTNRNRRFLRNRIRKEALPFLERALDRNLKATLVRTAEHVRADASYLDSLASEASRTAVVIGEDEIKLDVRALAEMPTVMASRIVRQALRLAAAALGGEWEPDFGSAHVRAVLDLTVGRPRRRVDLPGPLIATRNKEYVLVSRASPGARTMERQASRRGR
jgi:tRNA(Ile)-lysidine synthetase-like protein